MASSIAFKITASLIKPTRESVLDYCAYCLIVISLIGLARVWISGTGLKENCNLGNLLVTEPPSFNDGENALDSEHEPGSGGLYSMKKRPNHASMNLYSDKANDLGFKVLTNNFTYGPAHDVLEITSNPAMHARLESNSTTVCPKYYQATFAYVLLIESLILLLHGLCWVKVPKVNYTLKRFVDITHACQKSEWAKRALAVLKGKRTSEDLSQSVYSFVSADHAGYDMRSLLDTLFHPDSPYQTKAKARHLYEKVQTFCQKNSGLTDVWTTYIIKSLLQFVWWIIVFNINLVLFVMFEFYVVCPELDVPCDHDTFLRIVWYMGQTVLFIYGVVTCKTLRWINEKSRVRHGVCRCPEFNSSNEPLVTCRAYRYESNPPVYNDMAVMLHLLEEAHPKVLPYFVVFMFSEWKEKLTLFANPVQFSEMPMRSSMQMLSGRPAPTIEITDIPLQTPRQSLSTSIDRCDSPKKKTKTSVTFCLESESSGDRGVDAISLPKTGVADIPGSKLSWDDAVHQIPNATQQPWVQSVSPVVDGPPALSETSDSEIFQDASSQKTGKKGEKQLFAMLQNLGDVVNGKVLTSIADETIALVHRSSSSETIESCENGARAEPGRVSDSSETQLLL